MDDDILSLKVRVDLLEKLISSDTSNSGSNANSSNGSRLVSIYFGFIAGVVNYLGLH